MTRYTLDDVVTAAEVKPPRVVIYGVHGVGKTTWAAGAPSPIFLPAEDGLGRLQVPHFPTVTSYGGLLQALHVLVQAEHEYRTVVVDSLDAVEPLVWAETCDVNNWQHIEEPGYGKGYALALPHWRRMLAGCDMLRDAGMTVILIAHATTQRYHSPITEAYDRYQPRLKANAADVVLDWADAVLFADYRTHTVQDQDKRSRGIGQGERVCYTEERPAWKAKNRYALPTEIEMSWSAFANGTNATKEQDNG